MAVKIFTLAMSFPKLSVEWYYHGIITIYLDGETSP